MIIKGAIIIFLIVGIWAGIILKELKEINNVFISKTDKEQKIHSDKEK